MPTNTTSHIISDILDPTKGSEFQVSLVALTALARCSSGPILLWTTRRGSNEHYIRNWLSEKGLAARVKLNLIEMKHADSDGCHPTPWHFLLDLTVLYRRAAREIRPGEFVWKCGQANVLFYLYFLLWMRCDVLGPLSGLERPLFHKMYGITERHRFKYALYAVIVRAARWLLMIAHYCGRFKFLIGATSHDMIFTSATLRHLSVHYPEVDLDDLLIRLSVKSRCPASTPSLEIKLLWAGMLIERKNPLLAVEVLARMLTCYPQLSARMIGSGALQSAVETAVAQLSHKVRDRLILSEFVARSEFLALLSQIDILLVTSIREANSLLVLEALAAGVIVVSTKVSGMCDTVSQSGYLVEIDGDEIVTRFTQGLESAIRCGAKKPPRDTLIQCHKVQRERLDQMLKRAMQ